MLQIDSNWFFSTSVYGTEQVKFQKQDMIRHFYDKVWSVRFTN